jgi:PAS domain S-box-containing protein
MSWNDLRRQPRTAKYQPDGGDMMFADRAPIKPRFPLRLWQGLVLIIVPALALIGIEIYQLARNVPELRRSQDLVAHSMEVRATANELERAAQDAERGLRGFLITGNPDYLEPYRTGVKTIPNALAKLKQLTLDNPEQQSRWPLLEKQLDIKLGELKRTIEVRQTDGFDAARRIVETNVGADAMLAIDQIIDAAVEAEYALLTKRLGLGDMAERNMTTASLIGGGVAVILLGLGCVLIATGFRRFARSERALRESQERFRLLVSGIENYAIFVLDREGRVLLWNEGAERMTGYKADEVIGNYFSCFYEDEDVRSGTPEHGLEAARTTGSYSTEGWRVRKDGSRFLANVLITAIRDGSGALRGFAKLTQDITERKEAEKYSCAKPRVVSARSRSWAKLRKWTCSVSLPAALPMTSTICSA